MSRKSLLTLLSLLVVASLLLTSCGAKTPAVQPPAGSTYADTIIIGTWQQPRSFLQYANNQAIRVEIDLLFRPRFIMLNNFKYTPNPDLVEGDLPSLTNGGAVLKDVTVKAGEPIFNTTTFMVEPAAADTTVKQLVVTGHLKAGLKWDDGEPLTAHDIVFAWQKNCEADSDAIDVSLCPYNSVPGAGGIISSFEAPNDTTMVASYVPGALDPTYFLTPYNIYGILPYHQFKDMKAGDIVKDERATGGTTAVPLGYGPYKMVSWAMGDSITFAANSNWSGTPAKTPNIIYKFYADSTSLAAAVIAGEIDSTSGQTGLAVDQAPYMESVAKRGIINYSVDKNATSFEMLYFNYNDPRDPTFKAPNPVLSEYCVRKAISLALDRQQMVDTIYYGDSAVVQQPQLPQMASYDESKGILAYDPELAKKTLTDCGWIPGDDGIRVKNGVRASTNYLTTSGNTPRQKASQVLQANLKDIGIEVNLTYQPSSVVFSNDGLYDRNFDMIQFANTFSVIDPGTWWYEIAYCGQIPTPENQFSGNNYAGWCNKAASDASVDQAYLTLDEAKRKADWSAVLAAYFSAGDPSDYTTGGLPLIPLYTRPNYLATNPNLSGAALDSTEYFTWNAATWTLKE